MKGRCQQIHADKGWVHAMRSKFFEERKTYVSDIFALDPLTGERIAFRYSEIENCNAKEAYRSLNLEQRNGFSLCREFIVCGQCPTGRSCQHLHVAPEKYGRVLASHSEKQKHHHVHGHVGSAAQTSPPGTPPTTDALTLTPSSAASCDGRALSPMGRTPSLQSLGSGGGGSTPPCLPRRSVHYPPHPLGTMCSAASPRVVEGAAPPPDCYQGQPPHPQSQQSQPQQPQAQGGMYPADDPYSQHPQHQQPSYDDYRGSPVEDGVYCNGYAEQQMVWGPQEHEYCEFPPCIDMSTGEYLLPPMPPAGGSVGSPLHTTPLYSYRNSPYGDAHPQQQQQPPPPPTTLPQYPNGGDAASVSPLTPPTATRRMPGCTAQPAAASPTSQAPTLDDESSCNGEGGQGAACDGEGGDLPLEKEGSRSFSAPPVQRGGDADGSKTADPDSCAAPAADAAATVPPAESSGATSPVDSSPAEAFPGTLRKPYNSFEVQCLHNQINPAASPLVGSRLGDVTSFKTAAKAAALSPTRLNEAAVDALAAADVASPDRVPRSTEVTVAYRSRSK